MTRLEGKTMQKGQKGASYFGTVFGRKHMTEAEWGKIIAAAAGNRWSKRDQTMLRFCFRHGLRVSELVALRWTDIVWTDHAAMADFG
jgi:integrase